MKIMVCNIIFILFCYIDNLINIYLSLDYLLTKEIEFDVDNDINSSKSKSNGKRINNMKYFN
jgi:hypothetical protein